MPSRLSNFLRLGRIVLYVCRPLNGKHKTNILCALCGFAVNKILNLNRKCLIIIAKLVIHHDPK